MLEAGRKLDAVHLLQGQLMPRVPHSDQAKERVHDLAKLIMCSTEVGAQDTSELRRLASWSGSSTQSRRELLHKLQGMMPANLMLPPKRLEALMSQAL